MLIGWLVGMLLPVCSLGVIPVVREMHRAGVKGGTIIAFGLTAPLFNPMSVLYGLTLSDPIAILSFSLCALVIVSCLGLIWDRVFPRVSISDDKEQMTEVGIKRVVAVFAASSRELVGSSALFILIGVLGSAVVAAALTKGSMQAQAEVEKRFAPVVMAVAMTPVYATPLQAMAQIGSMFQHGNSIGAAFSLLILGAGANFGLLLAFAVNFGFRRIIVFLVLLMSITVFLAYCIDKPLYPKGVSPAGHTHAFDVYTHPYNETQSNLWSKAINDIRQYRSENDFGGTYLLLGFLVFGSVIQLTKNKLNLDEWLHSETQQLKRYDTVLPDWAVGAAAVIGLIALSVYGTFIYYLPPDELLADLTIVNTEVVLSTRTKDLESVEKWVPYCDDLSRRLEVGLFLRTGKVSDFQSAKAKSYRNKLDEIRDAFRDANFSNVDEMSTELFEAYERMRKAFQSKKSSI